MTLSRDFGLGSSGLDLAGIGLGGDTLEFPSGVAPSPIVEAISISFYVQCDFQQNPEQVGGGLRLDMRWSTDGTRVISARDSSNRFDMHDVSPAFSIAPGTWTNKTRISERGIGSVCPGASRDAERWIYIVHIKTVR